MKSTGVYTIIPKHIFHSSMNINQWNIFGGGRGERNFHCTQFLLHWYCVPEAVLFS